ncbi:MAG: Na+/H+ antiporter subunit D [Deltaproteobacteria bacterium]|nr:Na+/H+ antiporter subunit D [Deltaproteobacteria bacterium]
MKSILLFPLLIPFVTSVASLLTWNRRRLQRLISVCGAGALFAAAILLLATVRHDGIQALQIGNWPAPFGITLVADLFSAMMVAVAGLMGISVVIYSLASADIEHEAFGYHPLLHILLLGVCGSFVTGDLFNLYVWFEVMLIASFVLLALGGQRVQMEGAIKYVALNLIASTFFLSAIGILYGVAGTLNMADLARYLQSAPDSGLMTVLAMLFLIAFGIKSAIFPLFFWLPASYHTPPTEVSAIFAGLLTKVGVYSLIRVFTLLFVRDIGFTHGLILLLSGLTMVTGVLGAVAQNEFRRVLSFHIISQVGYMLLGLGLFTTAALAGSVFYIIHHIIVKTNLFLVSGVVRRLRGTLELGHLGGLYHSAPVLALLFLIPALSLAGLPPLSGFWAKLVLVRAALEVENYPIVVIALLVGLLTLLSMTKIWGKAFWGETPVVDAREIQLSSFTRLSLYLPMIILALLTVGIGLLAEPLYAMSLRAAEQLLNPAGYIDAVLGRTP